MPPISQAIRARLGYITLYTAIGALFPYIAVYYRSLGLGLGAIGLFAALSSASGMVGAPFWGATADRFGRSRLVIAIPAAIAAAAFAVLAFESGPWAIGAMVVVGALCMAGVSPVLDARALETVPEDQNRFAYLRAWGSLSFIAGVLFVGWLIDRVGIRGLFVVLVGALLATAIVGLGLRSQSPAAPLPRLTALASVLRTSLIMRFLAVVLVVWTANSAINAFFSVHLIDIGASGTLVGAAWAIGAAVEVPLMFAFPWLAARIGLERLLVMGAALFVVRAFSIALVGDPVLATMTMVIHGAAFALVLVGGVAYVSRHAPSGAAAAAQGVLSATVFGLAMTLGPGLGGLVAAQLGLPGLFLIAGLGSAIAVVVLAWTLAVERPQALPVGPPPSPDLES